jgi:hypothetical protein
MHRRKHLGTKRTAARAASRAQLNGVTGVLLCKAEGKELPIMEEPLSEDSIQELLDELEEEYGAPEPPPPDVEELLRELLSGSDAHARREAAEQLGKLDASNPRIVQALIVARKSDTHTIVRDAAARALRAPAHQECMQEHPDVLEATEGILQELRVLQRSRGERPRRPKKRRRRPKTTAEQAATQGEEEREKQKAIEVREVHDRREPKVAAWIPGFIVFGIVWVSVVGIFSAQSTTDFCRAALGALPGIALVAWGLLNWRAATVRREVLLRSTKETVGTVEDLWNEEHKGEYETSYTYYVTVRFEAEDAKVGTRVMVLKASVSRDVWKGLIEDQSVRIRYAAEDPEIALFQWEW